MITKELPQTKTVDGKEYKYVCALTQDELLVLRALIGNSDHNRIPKMTFTTELVQDTVTAIWSEGLAQIEDNYEFKEVYKGVKVG